MPCCLAALGRSAGAWRCPCLKHLPMPTIFAIPQSTPFSVLDCYISLLMIIGWALLWPDFYKVQRNQMSRLRSHRRLVATLVEIQMLFPDRLLTCTHPPTFLSCVRANLSFPCPAQASACLSVKWDADLGRADMHLRRVADAWL